VVIECKQSRSDFLRDSDHADRLLALREQLDRIRRSIEQNRIKSCEPHLRRGGSALFADLEDWDFSSSRLPAYRQVLQRLKRIDQRLHGHTKFFLTAQYRLADFMYVAAPRGLVRPRELPSGWGLLECDPRELDSGGSLGLFDRPAALHIASAAVEHRAQHRHRLRLLRNIAVSASAALARCSLW
jgi:hypothetical protein